jgi:histone deacetylase 1/2
MYLLVYVDDIILISSSKSATDHLVIVLGVIDVKDLGKLHYFLGLEVTHCDAGFTLTRQKYSMELMHRAGMLKCKAATTPMSAIDRLTALTGDLLYHSLIGGLQYLTITRSDLSCAINQFCQFLHTPRDSYITAVKHILCHLCHTTQFVLRLWSDPCIVLAAFSDTD